MGSAALALALVAGGTAATAAHASPAHVSPAAAAVRPAVSVTGGADIAYQNNAGVLETVTADGVNHNTGLGMPLGTSPSIAAGPQGKYAAVMQANTGVLWAVNSNNVGTAQAASVLSGTSPSVSYDSTFAVYRTYFQTPSGKLGLLFNFGGKDLDATKNIAVDPQTSPATGDGDVATALSGVLTAGFSDPVFGFPTLGQQRVAPGSSPSVELNKASGFFQAVAWQADVPQDYLRYATVDGGDQNAVGHVFKTTLGMMPGTSPAIALQPGGVYEVAFQGSDGNLWIVDSQGHAHNTRYGLDRRSSPSITALPGGGFEIAVQVNNHALWTVSGTTFLGQSVPGAEMREGTSPSISAFIAA